MKNVIKQKVVALNGNEAVAYAVKQSDVDVVAAYPITPQTIIVERFSEYVANGEVETAFVCTESEHSAMTACLTAALTGARTFTATASAGLALMHEMLFVTAGCRAPVVMAVANRALSAPLNIHGDQSDAMAQRDSGWIQLYVENAQEVYDTVIQAFKIAENPNVLLPAMVCFDGFIVSHSLENVNVLPDDAVKAFLGMRQFPTVLTHDGVKAPFRLDPEHPMTLGPAAFPNYYFEIKRQQVEALKNALSVIRQVHDEYAELSGRSYGNGLIEAYRLEDAEVATVCLGSTAGTTKIVVDELREEGVKAGLLRIRTFRPLPVDDIRRALQDVKAVAVLDKCISFGGFGGPVFHEVRHVLYDLDKRPVLVNYIYGLGGRDVPPWQIRQVYEDLKGILKEEKVKEPVNYLGLRE
ncbi:MAG: pyruvate ferredoxin oxidoreductase [Candidatus Bathyarchaeota archaeon]|nr:pyruvate ferredoxin oxidoreductase [Candidatus Bathyarchaeota archaeon]MCX8177862.1 pyruvate ferredoxin oxidoreductase [Candidatus Bathyarchaeota archaeon]MDW8193601.1 transketolase C-terminal domain-containing protein [Nitrososphaerota archaeon]